MRDSKKLAKELSSRSQSFHPTPGRNRRRIVANCIPFETFFYSRFVLSYMRARTHVRTHARTHAGTRGLDSSVLLLTQRPIKAAKRVRLLSCVLPSGRARITSIVAKTIAIAGALTSRNQERRVCVLESLRAGHCFKLSTVVPGARSFPTRRVNI